jgi:hypothetical protein
MTAKGTFRVVTFAGAIILGFLMVRVALNWWADSRLKAKFNFLTFSNFDKAQNSSKGEGVKVAICDWLFDSREQASGGYIDAASMIPGEPFGTDKPWHGEWMAQCVRQAAPACKIIPIRCRTRKNDFQQYLVKGIRYAADHGAVAVTSSMGPLTNSAELREAVDYAEAKGTLFINVHPVFEAGSDWCELNQKVVISGVVSVPRHRAHPESDRDVFVWPYSLTPTFLDGWGYSLGPPIVAGAVALMKSANPSLTPQQIKQIVLRTAFIKDGFRVLNAEAAVHAAMQNKAFFQMQPNSQARQ